MRLDHHDLSQLTTLAHMRHQDLLADAQRRRLIDHTPQNATRRTHVPAWRRRLGQQLVAWGEALQAAHRSHATPTGGNHNSPALRGPVFAQSTPSHSRK